MTTAEAVIERLQEHGVRYAFGIPGTHNLRLYESLARSTIEHVTPRHEQGAGYAADAYARSGGPPALCLATSGPGVFNLVTAVATAYADSVPMVVLAPGMAEEVEGRDTGFLHESRDQLGTLRGVTACAVRAPDPQGAVDAVDSAFARFASERPRPVYIEIPLDAMTRVGDSPPPPPESPPPPEADADAVAAAARLLREADRAALVLGGGAIDAENEALAVARALGAPVVTTANGKGIVPEDDPLALGASIRLQAAQGYLEGCDAVLAVGTELAHSDLWRRPPLPLGGALIRLDVDPDQAQKNAAAEVSIVADAAAGLGALAAELEDAEPRDRGAAEADRLRARIRGEALRDAAEYEPLIAALDAGLPDDGILTGDSTMACYYGAVHLLPLSAPRRFLYPTGFATLGYAIPAAVGAKLAQPDRDVVALIGDGGAMFTLTELAVAAELGLAVVVLVVNDGGYGEIRRQMAERSQPLVGVDLTPPDFPAAARALGARGVLVSGPGELASALGEAFAAAGPTLVEIRVD